MSKRNIKAETHFYKEMQKQLRAMSKEHINIDERCECCGKVLEKSKAVWLHRSNKTNLYYTTDLPEAESQGWFAFGRFCATKVLGKGGKCKGWRG